MFSFLSAPLISIHAPPRGATARTAKSATPCVFQFTPLREGRLFRLQRDYHGALISIHAPPRGATISSNSSLAYAVFQFTPLREGRPNTTSVIYSRSYFNSRPSARGDKPTSSTDALANHFNSRPSARGDSCPMGVFSGRHISIHAPPRGATCVPRFLLTSAGNFNSRPSARGDSLRFSFPHATRVFQFTPLREGRRRRELMRREQQ